MTLFDVLFYGMMFLVVVGGLIGFACAAFYIFLR